METQECVKKLIRVYANINVFMLLLSSLTFSLSLFLTLYSLGCYILIFLLKMSTFPPKFCLVGNEKKKKKLFCKITQKSIKTRTGSHILIFAYCIL